MAIDCGIIKVGGAWYTLPNGDKVQGAIKVREYFQENPDDILQPLEEILETSGYSTMNEELLEAAELAEESENKDGKQKK
jgi:hypothetical protein